MAQFANARPPASRDMLPTSAMLMWMGCPVSKSVHSIQKRIAVSFDVTRDHKDSRAES